MEGQRMEIGYMLLDPKLNFIEERAICKVRIPSEALPGYLDPVVADPTAVLLLKTTDDIHCIKMMRESQHPNIMHALVVGQKGNYITVWAESHTGPVASCLDKIVFRTSNIRLMSGGKILLPTTMLQSLVSQIFDGLEYLKLQGKYHGNFSLENTYYQQSGDEIVVKLTGFKLKDSKFNQQHQAVDCQDVGKALKSISEVAGQYSKGRQCFDCYQINDLAEKLKEVSWGDIPYIYQEIRGHPFFWDFETTKLFFVSQIPLAMNSSTFRSKVNGNEEICPHLPWSYDGYDGLLNLMDRFRQRKNIPDYDKNSRVGYVQFLSGLYAHEKELQAKVSVDTAVRQRNPRIFLILYNMVPKPLRFSTSN